MKFPVPSLGRVVVVYERARSAFRGTQHAFYAGRVTSGSTAPHGRISVAFDDPLQRRTFFLDNVIHVSQWMQYDDHDYAWDWPPQFPDIEVEP